MSRHRIPNGQLRALLAEARLTGAALARAVNAAGAEVGLSLRYDRSAVTHWLSGMLPRSPVPELVAEVLSRDLRRQISPRETGLSSPEHWPLLSGDLDPWWQADVVRGLTDLVSRGARRPALGAGRVYSMAALSIPGFARLAEAGRDRRWKVDADAKVGRAEVDAAVAMTGLVADADAAFGGGRVYGALSNYLGSTVSRWLRADASPAVRRDLLAAAARLTYLAGFACFDEEVHGDAQFYYLVGLRLAAEAGDIPCYAMVLRALSVQARVLGHHQQAVNLAEAAVRAVPGGVPPRTRALLFGQLAAANAAAGNRREALAHLIAAEHHLEQVRNATPPVGVYHKAALAHQHAVVLLCLGDRPGAMRALESSIHHRPASERRSRAITLARLAELQLADGQLEQACGTWSQFLDDYPLIQSHRADTALTVLRARIRPHQNNTVARALSRRATVQDNARRTRGLNV